MKNKYKQIIDKVNNDFTYQFYNEFIKTFKDIKFELCTLDYSKIRIIDVNNNMGDIIISVWIKEITISIGSIYHIHFETDAPIKNISSYDFYPTIKEAIEFIQLIINDEMLIKINYSKAEALAIYSRELNSIDKTPDTLLYSWSGKNY